MSKSKKIASSTIAILNLFKAVWVTETISEPTAKQILDYKKLLTKTMPFGYVIDPRIDTKKVTANLLKAINDSIGLSAEQMNQTFHKSWQTIVDCSHEQLAMQQMTHYMTTYGFENMGIYDQDSVYIPNEVLEIPALQKSELTLQVVHAIDTQALIEKIFTLSAGIALAKETLADLLTIIRALFNTNTSLDRNEFVQKIANRELNTLLADEFNIVPTESVAFLRHVIYQLTGETLLIKNKKLIDTIKTFNKDVPAIKKMDKTLKQAPENLASIFLRYKPLFLALKSISYNKKVFNRLRKDAKKQHQPLPVDYLNNVTNAIKTNSLEMTKFTDKVAQATIYRKIRLANALRYRLNVASSSDTHSIVYRVRNGRGFATEFDWADKHYDITEQAFDVVVSAIADAIRPNVANKIFYMPKNVNYTLPATEKQFTGNFPTGSWVSVADNMIVGIHWENIESSRIDLDLSLMDLQGTKIGWDASYKSKNNNMIFSGDITDAPLPKGATELFYMKNGFLKSQALMVNYFNHSKDRPVPCKLVVAQEQTKNFGRNYMIDPNNIVMQTQFHLTEQQNMLGLINNVNGENRIYFSNINLGTSISSYGRDDTKHAQQYLLNISENVLMLRDVLEMAGATVVDTMPEQEEDVATVVENKQKGFLNILVDLITDSFDTTAEDAKENDVQEIPVPQVINLSPAHVDKTTFIELMQAC